MIYNNIDKLLKDTNHCIIHGLAGTGKSTLIGAISDKMGERCLKLAPTGLSAYNINGTTIDSLLFCYQKAQSSTLERMGISYDCIIVDEISMVHYYKLDKIFQIVEKLQSYGKIIKLILVGDPFQLPPVTTENMLNAYSKRRNTALTQDDFYFFNSEYFKKYINSMNCFLLKMNYRQNDMRYAIIIEKIATGTADKYDLEYINQQIIQSSHHLPIQNTPVVTPTRNGTKFFNNIGLSQLEEIYTHNAFFEKTTNGYYEIEADYRDITEPVTYAKKAPVIFTQNNHYEKIVNGTKGFIRRIECCDPEKLEIHTDNDIAVQCVPTRHFLYRFIYNENTRLVDNECVAIIRQFPFILGFALTIHKCQGMTLNKMTFNPAGGCFAPGQLYVALSRVKNISDLTLHVPIRPEDIIISREVFNYFNIFKQECEII